MSDRDAPRSRPALRSTVSPARLGVGALLVVVLGLLPGCGGGGGDGQGPSVTPTRTPTESLSPSLPSPTRTPTATVPSPTRTPSATPPGTETPSEPATPAPSPTSEPTTPDPTTPDPTTPDPTTPQPTTPQPTTPDPTTPQPTTPQPTTPEPSPEPTTPEPSREPSAEPPAGPTSEPTPTESTAEPTTEAPAEATEEQAGDDEGVPSWVWWVVAALVLGCGVTVPLVVRARRRAAWRRRLERQEAEVEWFARDLLRELRAAGSHQEMTGGWAVSQDRLTAAEDELTVLESTAPDEAGRDRARTLRDASRHARERMQELVAPGPHDTWALDLDRIMDDLDEALRPEVSAPPPG